MACKDIIYEGNTYTEDEIIELANTGKLKKLGADRGWEDRNERPVGDQVYGDLAKEHTYIADSALGFNEMRDKYKAEKERVLALGAKIQIDNGKELKYILPEDSKAKNAPQQLSNKQKSKVEALINKWLPILKEKTAKSDFSSTKYNYSNIKDLEDIKNGNYKLELSNAPKSGAQGGQLWLLKLQNRVDRGGAEADNYPAGYIVIGGENRIRYIETNPEYRRLGIAELMTNLYRGLSTQSTGFSLINNPHIHKLTSKLGGISDSDTKSTISPLTTANTFYQTNDNKPSPNAVRATMRSVEVAQTPTSVVNWSKVLKGSITFDQFLDKSQFPKEQKALLQDIYNTEHPKTLGDLITSMVAKYSYTVEINTATRPKEMSGEMTEFYHKGTNYEIVHGSDKTTYFKSNDSGYEQSITKEEFHKAYDELKDSKTGDPTQHYSNLTVPGGINYTENEIATPGIVPSIKGHAQFSTDNGIGWFRSDDKVDNRKYGSKIVDEEYPPYMEGNMEQTITDKGTPTKTRRILEVQSDLFQKGRDKEDLASKPENYGKSYGGSIPSGPLLVKIREVANQHYTKPAVKEGTVVEVDGKKYESVNGMWFNYSNTVDSPSNKFLQLLNKDGNWIPFFIKSIVQDSAKKGYDKIWWPTGDTASKVEGHESIEEFKKQKEDRLKSLDSFLSDAKREYDKGYIKAYAGLYRKDESEVRPKTQEELDGLIGKGGITATTEPTRMDGEIPVFKYTTYEFTGSSGRTRKATQKEYEDAYNHLTETQNIEKGQLQEELKRVETEGFAALKPIYNFYEVRVKNTLDKIYGKDKVQRITDEHGNEWYQVEIDKKRDNHFLYQTTDKKLQSSKASDATVEQMTTWFKQRGTNLKVLTDGIYDDQGNKLNVNESVNVLHELVQVVDGHQNTAIPEAGMHIVARIMKEHYPEIFKEMMKRADKFAIFPDVVARYKTEKAYQLPDGKPDMAKMKEETVGKVLAEHYIEDQEGTTEKPELVKQVQSWWQRIVQNLKDFFVGNPFSKTVDKFKSGELDTKKTTGKEDTFYQSDAPDKGKEVFDKIKEWAKNMRNITDANGDSINLVRDPVTGEEKSPEKRPSDYAKTIYERALGKKEPTAKDKVDRETGTRLHGYLQDIGNRFIDPDTGFKRKEPLPNKGSILPGEEHIYDALEDYFAHTIAKYPNDVRFMVEQMVYKPGKRVGKGDIGGTIDLLAIKPNGRTSNLDWKFMNEKNREDITATTKAAHRAQLNWYGSILKDGYQAGEADESQTIPFKLLYSKEKGSEHVLKNIVVGDTNYAAINDKTMLPVTSAQVTIEGDPKMTAFLQRYNKLLESTFNESVPARERLAHEKEVQDIENAIKSIILKKDFTGLANNALTMVKGLHAELKDVQDFINNQTLGDKKGTQEAAEKASNVMEVMRSLEIFRDLNIVTKDFIKDMPEDQKQKLNTIFSKIDTSIESASRMLLDPTTKTGILGLVGEQIANEGGIYNILSMDRELTTSQKLFNTITQIPIKTAQAFNKWRSRSRHRYEMMAADMAHDIAEISDRCLEWMGGTWDNKKLTDLIAKKDDKGNYKPFLANKIGDKFYEKLKDAIESEDNKWILDNIDTVEYKKDYEKDLTNLQKRAEQEVFDVHSYEDDPSNRKGTLDQELREKYVQWFKDTFDIDRKSGFTYRNNKLSRYALDEHWSDEFKALNKPENKPALDLYNYIIGLNKRAHNSGMLGDYYIHFMPQMRKRSLEHVIDGEFKKAGRSFISPFIREEGDRRYRDELTGEVINNIRGKYTYDLSENGDYSNVSDDVIKSITLFAKEVAAHEEQTAIDGIQKTLLAIEKTKQVLVYDKGKLQTDATGKPIGKDNKTNLQWLEDELKQSMYNEKGEDHLTEGTVTINGTEYHIDKAKTIDTLVNAFTLKAIGLNPMTAFANLFGGTANAYINSGRHFTKGEYSEALYNVLESKFYSENGKKLISLLDHFVPITEEVSRHLGKKASKKQVLEYLSGEGLMVFMRKTENIIQMANAAVFFRNTMIENGKLVNIRDYVRNKYDYANLYKKSESERNVIRELMDKEVHDLQESRNLFNDKNIKFNDKNFKIDWPIERYSDTELALREQIQQLTRDVLGNRTPEEMAHINMMLFGGALMNFRNWVPRLFQKRYGDFKYNGGMGTYEIGRMRMLGDVIADHAQHKLKNIIDAISYSNFGGGEQSLVDIARRQYQRRVADARTIEQTTDTMFEKTVSEGEFIDSYLRGVKAQVKELELTLAMMGAFFAAMAWAQSLPKDDNNYPERGVAKWSIRMLDKFSDELGFFYSPASFKGIVGSGNIIPITSVLTDLVKFTTNLTKEGYYLSTGDEVAEEKNHVVKYLVNYTPAVNQFSTYFGIFNEDWAKTMGYNANYRYGGAISR